MELIKYTVIYTEYIHHIPGWMFFICDAEDPDHAEEQCQNAYPGCDIVGIVPADNKGDAVRMLMAEFFD